VRERERGRRLASWATSQEGGGEGAGENWAKRPKEEGEGRKEFHFFPFSNNFSTHF